MPDAITPSTTEPAAPSTEQTPTSPSQSPDQPSLDDFGFEGGDRGGELDESKIFQDLDEVPEAPTAPTAQPVKTAPQPPAAQPPVAPTAPQPEAQPQAPAEHPVTAEQITQQFRQWRQNAEQVLSNSHYNLNQEDANQLNIDPGQVIPKLMSRVYLDAVTAAVNVISQALPYTVMNTIDAHNGYQKNEDEFFGEWPGLKDHHAEVIRTGQVFRHLNPRASKADFIRSVGAQVAMSLGLTAEQARGPSARQAPAGQRVLRHIPPAASARHAPAQPARPANIFEQMAQDTQEDD